MSHGSTNALSYIRSVSEKIDATCSRQLYYVIFVGLININC